MTWPNKAAMRSVLRGSRCRAEQGAGGCSVTMHAALEPLARGVSPRMDLALAVYNFKINSKSENFEISRVMGGLITFSLTVVTCM